MTTVADLTEQESVEYAALRQVVTDAIDTHYENTTDEYMPDEERDVQDGEIEADYVTRKLWLAGCRMKG